MEKKEEISDIIKASDSIVAKRLIRNLHYKLTYIQVFESFMQPNTHPAVARLLEGLLSAQQSAVGPLSSYLRGLGIETQDLPLNQQLLSHASAREDLRSRLRFIHYGLSKAASWYKTQLLDGHMTADPELQRLLLELGENDAASLWHTETVMDMLEIRREPAQRGRPGPSHDEPQYRGSWRTRLISP